MIKPTSQWNLPADLEIRKGQSIMDQHHDVLGHMRGFVCRGRRGTSIMVINFTNEMIIVRDAYSWEEADRQIEALAQSVQKAKGK